MDSDNTCDARACAGRDFCTSLADVKNSQHRMDVIDFSCEWDELADAITPDLLASIQMRFITRPTS